MFKSHNKFLPTPLTEELIAVSRKKTCSNLQIASFQSGNGSTITFTFKFINENFVKLEKNKFFLVPSILIFFNVIKKNFVKLTQRDLIKVKLVSVGSEGKIS